MRVKLPKVFRAHPEKIASKRKCGRCTACCECPTLAAPGAKELTDRILDAINTVSEAAAAPPTTP